MVHTCLSHIDTKVSYQCAKVFAWCINLDGLRSNNTSTCPHPNGIKERDILNIETCMVV